MKCGTGCSRAGCLGWVRGNVLLLATMAAVVLGTGLGFGLRPLNLSYEGIAWIKIWGELFMRMLKMIILPLVTSCIVVGVSSMENRARGRVGAVTLGYIMITQLIGVLVGLVLTVAIHPGTNLENEAFNGTTPADTSYTDIFGDFLRNLFPDNVVRACLESAYTDVTEIEVSRVLNSSLNLTRSEVEVNRKLLYRSGTNMMGVIVFSVALAIGISVNGEYGKPLLKFFESLNKVIFSVMVAIIWYSPVGICSLIAGSLLEVDDLQAALVSLGMYVMTVLVGQLAYMFIILPLILLPLLRCNTWKYLLHLMHGMLAAFAPPSSAASLPFLVKDSVEKIGADARVVGFVAPVAITLNRDGSAMFITTASIFVAQTFGMSLSAADYCIISLLVSLLVSAVAAVPSSSIVVLIMVCEATGIPISERVGLLMAVEWLVDRFRTACNTESHGYAIITVDKLCRNYVSKRLDTPAQTPTSDAPQGEVEANGHAIISSVPGKEEQVPLNPTMV